MIQTKTFHILNGDALLDFFPSHILTGEMIIARECLVDGPVTGNELSEFWKTRAAFISETYGEDQESYYADVVSEFNKILAIPVNSEVNLWFEHDLFCQVNLWFCVSLLLPVAYSLKVNIVSPGLADGKPDWRGFGVLDRHKLADVYQNRKRLTLADLGLLSGLWDAYKAGNGAQLKQLAQVKTENFPFLGEVVQAHLDRHSDQSAAGRPERVLREIMEDKQTTDFSTIFREFGQREGIYGFGDWQVEELLKNMGVVRPD